MGLLDMAWPPDEAGPVVVQFRAIGGVAGSDGLCGVPSRLECVLEFLNYRIGHVCLHASGDKKGLNPTPEADHVLQCAFDHRRMMFGQQANVDRDLATVRNGVDGGAALDLGDGQGGLAEIRILVPP